jgi:hypothetical protein
MPELKLDELQTRSGDEQMPTLDPEARQHG